jgi:hypothetical protein
MVVAIWIVALLLLGLWSLLGWGLAQVLAFEGQWVLAIEPWLAHVPFADLLERWWPTWQDSARLLLELGQAALGWLGQAAPVIVWTLWGLGAVLLLGAAGLMNLLVVLLRRRLPAAQAGMQGA